jgi:hypothetical protein
MTNHSESNQLQRKRRCAATFTSRYHRLRFPALRAQLLRNLSEVLGGLILEM